MPCSEPPISVGGNAQSLRSLRIARASKVSREARMHKLPSVVHSTAARNVPVAVRVSELPQDARDARSRGARLPVAVSVGQPGVPL